MQIEVVDETVESNETTETVDTGAEVTAAAPETTTDGEQTTPAEGMEAQAPAAPEYKPKDFKYNVWGEERELDERVKGLIKSEDDEKWLKKVFAAADGVEVFKQQREEVKAEYQRLYGEVQNVLKAVDLGDYKTAFQSMGLDKPQLQELLTGLGYTKDEIIRHAYDLAQLTPEQEQYYSRQRELERQNREYQASLSQTKQQLQDFEIQTKTQELQTALSTPDVAPIVNAFDAHHGQGAFWEEVRQRGLAHFAIHKRDMPVQQAVQEVVRVIRTGQQAFGNQQAATPAPQASKSSSSLPVIPSVGSGGTQTPARKKTRSVEDLRRYAAELTD